MADDYQKDRSGRKYRSKKQRPCDLCRSRKIQCKILPGSTVCELCLRTDRQCTFILQPLRKGSQPRAFIENIYYKQSSRQHEFGNNPDESELVVIPQIEHEDTRMTEAISSSWLQSSTGTVPTFITEGEAPLLSTNWSTISFTPDVNENNLAPREHAESDDYANIISCLSQSNDSLPRYPVLPTISIGSPSSGDMSNGSIDGQITRSEIGFTLGNAVAEHQNVAPKIFDWPERFSLDIREGRSSQLIGLSGESDPFLLRHYLYNEDDTYPMFRLDFRNVVEDETLRRHLDHASDDPSQLPIGRYPVQFVMTNESIYQEDLKPAGARFPGNGSDEGDLGLLEELVPIELAKRLFTLYARFVHPRFPVLSLSDINLAMEDNHRRHLPVGIQSAVYALATSFTFLDDELSVSKGYLQLPTEELWAITHRYYHRNIHFPHLSLLQTCLLLTQKPPQNFAVADTSSCWELSCSALAIAESLGLNLDPSSWRLPRKEMRLRRRLWWLTYTHHIWEALVLGRPSHINDNNWDVSMLTNDDFELEAHVDPEISCCIAQQIPLCIAFYSLSTIAADSLNSLYSLKAARETSSLPALLPQAQRLRARIEDWRQTLPLLSKQLCDLNDGELEQCASLRLSHLTLEILIFRALLRPLVHQPTSTTEMVNEPYSTIFENSLTCAKVGTELVFALKPKHFAVFWPPYVRYQLCYISSIMLIGLAQSPAKDMALRNRALLRKWRDIIRSQARAWPLAKLATMRLDAVFWKGLSSVVYGSGLESPAMMLLSQET